MAVVRKTRADPLHPCPSVFYSKRNHESTAKRVCHRRGAVFAEEIYCLAQTCASLCIEPRFVFVALRVLGVSAVRFCSEVNHNHGYLIAAPGLPAPDDTPQ